MSCRYRCKGGDKSGNPPGSGCGCYWRNDRRAAVSPGGGRKRRPGFSVSQRAGSWRGQFLSGNRRSGCSTYPPQQELEAEYTLESFAEKIKENGSGLNDPALLDAFIISVPDLYQELKEISGLYFDTLPQPDAKPYLHLSSQPDAALQFKQNLLERLKNSTVNVSEDKVKELIFSPRGQLEALVLESAGGETYRFYIQAAVLADGGYSGVAHCRHKYLPAGNLVNLRPAQKGEGLQLAEALDLDLVQIGFLNAQLLFYAPLGAAISVAFGTLG